ncbi:sugar phosphate isomerase/epimerase [Candidatus Poribacteria bacterium]|nr:sugar phosphate isomerase/epimerase [Candidatus Poribacteria bacterium]
MRIGFMMGYDKERMEFAKKVGFGSAELQAGAGSPFFPGNPDWEAKADEVKAAFAEMDIRISCIAAFYMNHMDPQQEENGKRTVHGAIQLAERMDVPIVAGFAGRIPNTPLEQSLPKFKEIWGEHAKFAEAHGVKIAFENCPMGPYHLPASGINVMCTPAMWEFCFNEVPSSSLGLEWDPSHLICMFIDPIVSLRKFGDKVHHVHAKDAHVNHDLLAQYGIWYPGVIEHCHIGLGDTDWRLAVKELRRHGYKGDLNIEGWHDSVYRNQQGTPKGEDEGLIISYRYLSMCVAQDGIDV